MAEILDAGAAPLRASLRLESSGFEVRAAIRNTTLRQGSGYGLYLGGESVLPEFSGNEITAHASGPVYVYAAEVHNLTATSSYAGNDQDFVFVNGAYEFGDEPRAWERLDVPYRVDGVFILYTHLTLEAGTRLEFTDESGLRVINQLAGVTAVGTAGEPIVFTGVTAEPGAWNGLYFANLNENEDPLPRSRFEHVLVEYGGAYVFQDSGANEVWGNFLIDSSGWPSAIELVSSTIRHSSGYGVWLDCEADLTSVGVDYADNALSDVGLEPDCS